MNILSRTISVWPADIIWPRSLFSCSFLIDFVAKQGISCSPVISRKNFDFEFDANKAAKRQKRRASKQHLKRTGSRGQRETERIAESLQRDLWRKLTAAPRGLKFSSAWEAWEEPQQPKKNKRNHKGAERYDRFPWHDFVEELHRRQEREFASWFFRDSFETSFASSRTGRGAQFRQQQQQQQQQRQQQQRQASEMSEGQVEARRHRSVLGLSGTQRLDACTLKDAFRECAKRWHPDVHQLSDKAGAEAKFKQAQSSYHFLLAAIR